MSAWGLTVSVIKIVLSLMFCLATSPAYFQNAGYNHHSLALSDCQFLGLLIGHLAEC